MIVWRGVLSAFCASLIGIGLARFAYTPLLPALISEHWFAPAAAAYLGAANLAGYLLGALAGRPLSARMPLVVVLRAMMLVVTAAFFACAYPLGFAWFFIWRFLAGAAGGVLMVLAAPNVLPHVAASRRGLAGGAIFMGIGVGVAISGTLVPLLLAQSLRETWFGLGAVSLLLTLVGWSGWPSGPAPVVPASAEPQETRLWTLRALYAEYGLNAAGWVPHMVFLVDFIARGRGEGIKTGSEYWVVFGLGATVGPLLVGYLADRSGFKAALRLAFLVQIAAIAVPALGLGRVWLIGSSFVVGSFLTATVPLVLGRIHELLPHHPAQQKAAWSHATVAFAVCQAVAAYGLSFVFVESGENYRLLFGIGSVAMILALAIDLLAALIARLSRDHPRASANR